MSHAYKRIISSIDLFRLNFGPMRPLNLQCLMKVVTVVNLIIRSSDSSQGRERRKEDEKLLKPHGENNYLPNRPMKNHYPTKRPKKNDYSDYYFDEELYNDANSWANVPISGHHVPSKEVTEPTSVLLTRSRNDKKLKTLGENYYLVKKMKSDKLS